LFARFRLKSVKPFEVGRALAVVFEDFLFFTQGSFDAIADDPPCATRGI